MVKQVLFYSQVFLLDDWILKRSYKQLILVALITQNNNLLNLWKIERPVYMV